MIPLAIIAVFLGIPWSNNMKYVTKPVIKDAEQFFEGKPLPFASENACCLGPDGWYVVTTHGHKTPIVDGDFIIREPNGNGFYPCKPDIFLKNHVVLSSSDRTEPA